MAAEAEAEGAEEEEEAGRSGAEADIPRGVGGGVVRATGARQAGRTRRDGGCAAYDK